MYIHARGHDKGEEERERKRAWVAADRNWPAKIDAAIIKVSIRLSSIMEALEARTHTRILDYI